MTDVPATPPSAPAARKRRVAWPWLVVLALLLLAGWRGWHAWQAREAREHALASATAQQWQALDARIDALRRDQRAQAQRLQQADATNRVLRDELLGLGQREALLEDSVAKLAEPVRQGARALRLDEVELLLGQGEQRLRLSGDLDGARRAYALAAGVLDGVDATTADGIGVLNLRQSLVQERAALDAPGADPARAAAAQLDAFTTNLVPPGDSVVRAGRDQPWWRRAFSRIVEVRPSNGAVAVDAGARAAGFATLQLELALARSALERRDAVAWRAALARVDGAMARLWPDSPQLRRRRAQLQALRALPLALALPALGSTRQQLQAMRGLR